MSSEESKLKKRLGVFLGEMLKLGTVKGFKYFATYMRGREEMILSVVNEPQTPTNSYSSEPGSPFHQIDVTSGSSFTSQNLPYDKRSLMLSHRTQMTLSGFGDKGVGLPPASPSDEETQAMDAACTVFLIAGYTRYSCPYVWVRSNHQRLVGLTGGDANERDSPLSLKSTSRWKDHDVFIWDVIAELVKLCTYPAPHNPFAVDISFFSSLSLSEQILATSSMSCLLQNILLHTADDKPYAVKVFEDLQMVMKCHFIALQKLAKEGNLPVMQKSQLQTKLSNSVSTRKRYPSSGHGGSQYSPGYTQQTASTYMTHGYNTGKNPVSY